MTRVTSLDDRSTPAPVRDDAVTALTVATAAAGALGLRNVVRLGRMAVRHPALVVAVPAIVVLSLLLRRERRRRLDHATPVGTHV